MSFFDQCIKFLQDGGFFMAPIGLLLIVGLVIALERWWFLRQVQQQNQQALDAIGHALQAGDLKAIGQQARQSDAPVLTMLDSGIQRLNRAHRRDDIEYAMEEVVLEISMRLQKRTPLLGTLANVATLLGLLGTIMGLITAFAAVASADPAQKASLLSSSISVAMNTTALGLMTAIPLVFVHSLLQSRTASIIDGMEMVGMKLLNSLSQQQGWQDVQKA